MDTFKLNKLPIDYEIDKELLNLLSEANEKYGEYKTLLKTVLFDSSLFLDSLILNESLKSTQIEGSQISQDDLYYLKYMKDNDDKREIENLKNTIEYIKNNKNKELNLDYINKLHSILLDSVRGSNKEPGKIRDIQNWIGPAGCSIKNATYIPPAPEEINDLLENLINYINDYSDDPILIKIAVTHYQFESIHAYRDGNGRLGRVLISYQMSKYEKEDPILFLSEIIELYRPTYYRLLSESRNGKITKFIKFFLQCVIDQCNSNIYKIKNIIKTYNDDLDLLTSLNSNAIYRIMPAILHQIVFTKKEIEIESKVSRNMVSKLIDHLVDIGIIEKIIYNNKQSYRYKKIYNILTSNNT